MLKNDKKIWKIQKKIFFCVKWNRFSKMPQKSLACFLPKSSTGENIFDSWQEEFF